MSKHSKRHKKARLIRATAKNELIRCDALGVEWIQGQEAAADGEAKPKRFSMVAYTGGPMVVGYYGAPVIIDLAGLQAADSLPILRDHDPSSIVGHADEVKVGQRDIRLSGAVSGVGPAALEILATAKNGFPWKASIGARPDKLEFVGEDASTSVNGKTYKGPLYVARKATLGEVSFVAVPADGRTSVKVVASARDHKESEMDEEFRQWIEAMGLEADELREDQKARLRTKFDAEVKAAAQTPAADGEKPKEPEPPAFDIQAIGVTYTLHEAQIEAKSAQYAGKIPSEDLLAAKAAAIRSAAETKIQAIKGQWPAVRLEAEYIKAAAIYEADLIAKSRPKAPAIHASTRDLNPLAIEAAFASSCGLSKPEEHYRPEVLEAADRHRNIGLKELLLVHAMANGYTGRMRVGNDNLREVIRAAFSTHSITTLLTSTGNKLLLDGFNQIPQSWRQIAGTAKVNDFKAVTAYRLTASLEYEEVGPTGEIKHGTLGQESYSMQAKTYAKLAALTRQDIINDDLGAFNDLRNRLGLGAAIKLNKVFWTLWINNSSFFTAARANLVTSSALAEAGLNTAVAAFRTMAGPDGNQMSLEPALLVVPPSLEATARKLYVSQEVRDTTSSTKYMIANIYYNRFRPVVVPELENANFTGYSTTTWYLLADPAVLATAVMCFLDGQQSPTIESTDADFDTLGIQFRGYHDFGAAFTEYRAGVKATA